MNGPPTHGLSVTRSPSGLEGGRFIHRYWDGPPSDSRVDDAVNLKHAGKRGHCDRPRVSGGV